MSNLMSLVRAHEKSEQNIIRCYISSFFFLVIVVIFDHNNVSQLLSFLKDFVLYALHPQEELEELFLGMQDGGAQATTIYRMW